jgi:hypothetical protein
VSRFVAESPGIAEIGKLVYCPQLTKYERTRSDKLTASSQEILDSPIAPDEMRLRNLASDKEDFLQAIKSGRPALGPLETAHRTISMSQLGLISIKTGAKLTWNPETEEIAGDNAASALMTVPVREKYCRL